MGEQFDDNDLDQANRQLVEQARREARDRALRDDRDLEQVMNTPQGQRLMHRLLVSAGIYTTSYEPGDPHATSFREGKRNFGLQLMSELLRVTPGQYNTMTTNAATEGALQGPLNKNKIED